MLGLGVGEIVIIIVIIIVIFFLGEEKISSLARGLGRFIGEFKKGKTEIEEEMGKVKEEIGKVKKELKPDSDKK